MGKTIRQKLPEMTINDIQKLIRDMYQIRRDIHNQITELNDQFEDAGNIIDCCEKELRKRGHI